MIHGTHASAKRCKCDTCAGFRREYMRNYREQNRERLREQARGRAAERNARTRARWAEDAEYREKKLDSHMKWRYGISVAEYDRLLAAQGGACAICKSPDPGARGFRVDHDHSCCPDDARSCGNCIRGLLCGTCNSGIGMLRDDPAVLEAAADYLRSTLRKLS